MIPELEFSLGDPRNVPVTVAKKFTGEQFPHTNAGLEAAMVVLTTQHEKTLPPGQTPLLLHQIVARKDSIIRETEQMSALALAEGDFEAAILTANYLHAYGEIDYQDSLGGEAFELSLRTHRALSGMVFSRFAHVDPFLRVAAPRLLTDLDALKKTGKTAEEIKILRTIIHEAALNGTLGEDAKQQFDPFAVVAILK